MATVGSEFLFPFPFREGLEPSLMSCNGVSLPLLFLFFSFLFFFSLSNSFDKRDMFVIAAKTGFCVFRLTAEWFSERPEGLKPWDIDRLTI